MNEAPPYRIRLAGSARDTSVTVLDKECSGLAAVFVAAAIDNWRRGSASVPAVAWDQAVAIARDFDVAATLDQVKRVQNAWSPFQKRVGLEGSCRRGDPLELALDVDWDVAVDILRAFRMHEHAAQLRINTEIDPPTGFEFLKGETPAGIERRVLDAFGWQPGAPLAVPEHSVLWSLPGFYDIVTETMVEAALFRARDLEATEGLRAVEQWLREIGEADESTALAGVRASELEREFENARLRITRLTQRSIASFLIGVDAGGTRTSLSMSSPAVHDAEFTVPVPIATARGAVQGASDVDAVIAAVTQRLERLYWSPEVAVTMVIAAAAYTETTRSALLPLLRSAMRVHRLSGTVVMMNDVWAPLLVSSDGQGVAAIAGTGSVVASRQLVDGQARTARLDGEEWLVSDGGSAFRIAREATMRALSYQQRVSCGLIAPNADDAALLRALTEHYGFEDLSHLGRHFADPHHGFSKITIASATEIVCRLADGGNTPAAEVVVAAAQYLGGLANELLGQFGPDESPVLSSTGSVVAHARTYREAFVAAALGANGLRCTPRVLPVAHDGSTSARQLAGLIAAADDSAEGARMLAGVDHDLLRTGDA